jgi:predicted membrane protein
MRRHHSPVSGHALFGVLVIVVGLIFLLNNLGIVDARYILSLWPVLFILLGIWRILRSRSSSSWIVGLLFIFFGSILTLHRLDVVYFSWHRWWPVILIIVGIAVVSRAWSGFRQGSILGGAVNDNNSDQTVNIVGFMGGSKIRNISQNFQGGDISAIMGGVELDLRQAVITREAVIDILSFWGGIDIKVPREWDVVNKSAPILGGIGDKTLHPDDPNAPRLIIRGYTIMGGADIKN